MHSARDSAMCDSEQAGVVHKTGELLSDSYSCLGCRSLLHSDYMGFEQGPSEGWSGKNPEKMIRP